MSESHTGRCLCGGVVFSTGAAKNQADICHCKQCRRWTGHQFAAINVALDSLVFERGEGRLKWYRASDYARRGFCGECGSSLFWHADRLDEHKDRIAVAAGSLDEPTGLKTVEHIFVKDRGDYYEIPEDGAERKETF